MRDKKIFLVLVTTPLAIILFIWSGVTVGQAQAPSRAGLVVQLGDGSLITRCVEFDEPEINGYDLLLRSGLSVVVSGDPTVGMAVCSIENEGCPASNCFCECKGSTCTYWSYWHLIDGGGWQYSSLGASGHATAPDSVDGWRWGEAEPPPVVSFEEICAPPATSTPTATATALPTPTWTSSPTLGPTDTPPPTLEPAATWTTSPTPIPPTDTPIPTDTPLPTRTPNPTATPVLPSAPTAGPSDTLASVPSPAAGKSGETQPTLSSTAGSSGEPQETPSPDPTGTPAPSPTAPAATPTKPALNRAAATQVLPATATPAQGTQPTATFVPTRVALAPELDPGAEFRPASRESSPMDSSNHLLTVFSVGIGVAYVFFGLFVVALAGLFIIVKLRQH